MGIAAHAAGRALDLVASRTFPVYAGLCGLYLVFRAGSFSNLPVRVTDTPSYEEVAAHPLWSPDFYGGVRPFTVPLLYKLVASDENRIIAQLVISTLCWLVLAAVVASAVRNRVIRPVAFATVLAFSLTKEVILWDPLLLSESLTFALTAVVLAAWLALVQRPTPARAGLVLVLLLFWTFARDSNAYVVLAVAVIVAVSLVDERRRRLKLALLGGCVVIFAASFASAEAGQRWLLPIHDVVFRRVIPTPDMSRYFAQHGLVTTGNWTVTPWLEEARGVYTGYLLRHPVYTLSAPFHGRQEALYSQPENLESLFNPSLRDYNTNEGLRFLPMPRLLKRALFPRGLTTLFAYIGAVVALAAVVAARARPEPIWVVPAGLLLTTYPHLLVAWHFSGYEVDRHALEAVLLLRLGVILLLVFAVDRAVAWWAASSRGRPRLPARASRSRAEG
jgi:hypothetical protein